ncbi:MAG TPA: nickel/cobalt efflux transporter [Mariprofundaceae bacterium]|nr:nickel/cobalt efflux transporter [Mariprofundaceae bacterium]
MSNAQDLVSMLQHGTVNLWLLIPSAILLGALHGLEPGHSKTMMAAFIIAVRGTVTQAALLGLSATLSHTAIVWIIAIGGLYFGRHWNAEISEPYLQVASAVLIVGVAVWMIWRTWRQQRACLVDHDHGHDHDHHHDEVKRIDIGHSMVRLEVFEQGVPPRFRLFNERGHAWTADQVGIETERPDGTRQVFTFVQKDGFLESNEEISEPHEFVARLSLGHEHHLHAYDVEFVEHDHHHHAIADYEDLDVSAPGYQDPHELAHANDIRRRFANKDVTTGQIVMFGLTGGLIPCPATITVLLLCLQLKKIALGTLLVLCFSVGLAVTMVATGVVAALSAKHVSRHWGGFEAFARKAPYLSGALILCVGIYVGYLGLNQLI